MFRRRRHASRRTAGNKVVGKIAKVRNLPEGTNAVSPPTFDDFNTPKDFKKFSDRVREITGGIPIGMKLSANHIEEDIDFAIESGVDYIILDGRGGWDRSCSVDL